MWQPSVCHNPELLAVIPDRASIGTVGSTVALRKRHNCPRDRVVCGLKPEGDAGGRPDRGSNSRLILTVPKLEILFKQHCDDCRRMPPSS